ncbi:MAG: oxidoreductase [Sulfobacillus benefaciens]|uniref:Oxidoreductase n=1 Tax=Sulfobacillus benefaciens TaxID=453960 RepID=A0A2T2XL07_9FIRM|nr:MAG: oxidoreductase [Sulfobacillus benefaciens]
MGKPIKALQLRHVDAGSCNGCEQELTALGNGFYDMQHFGIDVVASPRHADGLVVTGPVTDTMKRPLVQDWDAVPEPKWLIALGDCAAGCGVFQDAYACHGGVDGMRTPDLVISGCPPKPQDILQKIALWRKTLG